MECKVGKEELDLKRNRLGEKAEEAEEGTEKARKARRVAGRQEGAEC